MNDKMWTDKRTEKLTAMWAAGKSGAEIGAALDLSRNAILGKLGRMKLLNNKVGAKGRPMLALQVRLDDTETAALDEYRRRQSNPPTRPAAVRDLVRRVLMDGEPVIAIVKDRV